MSCRKTKSDGVKKSIIPEFRQYSESLFRLIAARLEMPVCFYCSSDGRTFCEISSEDSSRCSLCRQHNQPRCDRRPLTVEQLKTLGSQHMKVEVELDSAEAELEAAALKVRRLRV